MLKLLKKYKYELILIVFSSSIGVLAAYLLYASEYFSPSIITRWIAFVFLVTITLAATIIFLSEIFKAKKILSAIKWIFIGFVVGLYAPIVLGRETIYLQPFFPVFSSEIYSLTLREYDLPNEVLGYNGEPRFQTHNNIEVLDDENFLLLSSPQTSFQPSSLNDAQLSPEVYLTLLSYNGSIDIIDKININHLNVPIGYTKDLLYYDGKIFISSININNDRCVTLQLWTYDLTISEFLITNQKLLFESRPVLCNPTNLIQSGGRIVKYDSNHLLLTVGDFRLGASNVSEEMTGYTSRPDEMISPNTYGMIMKISLINEETVPYSIGHRNPQGLYVDSITGNIWSTEHGPRGGGELNLIIEGLDYGWPDRTYGIPYGPNLPSGNWDFSRWNNHEGEGITKPRFSWMPSIAPSQLLLYRGNEFPGWEGDLLVATLGDTSIRRLRLDNTRVVYDERIFIGERIRNIKTLPNGQLVMTYDSGRIAFLTLE